MKDLVKVKKVLISVSDKTNISSLASELNKYGVSIFSTGNTYKKLHRF